MDQITAIALMAGIVLALLLVPIFGTLFLAATATAIFVWRKAFPLGWGIAEWITNRRNLIPFVLFMLIVIAGSIILLILSYIFATQVHWVGYLFLLLSLIILAIAEIIFWGGFWLAMILWIIRLSHWAYALFRRGFWRTFRPGGPPDFQPVPVPLTNPLLVAPPPVQRTRNRGRQPLIKRRKITAATFPRPSGGEAPARAEEQAQVKKEAKRRRPAARQRETSPTTVTPPSNEMAVTRVEAKRAKAQAKEEAKQAKIQAKEDDKQAKAQAKEEAKQAKIQANEDAKQAKIQAKEDAKQAKIQAEETKTNQAMAEVEEKAWDKEEAKKATAEGKSGEIINPGRRRRLKRNR